MRVKDGIRAIAIQDIVYLLQQGLANYEMFSQELVNEMLIATATLIDWNALELFAPMLDMFKAFLQKKPYQRSALKCLFAFVHKGMDYPQKLEVISGLHFIDILESFKLRYPDRTENDYDK